ncbi:MAG TPA: 5-oxoprolinase subunit PxpB [Candidatus Limnocylindrales bacterium]|nr:5-oxoprolinase subunit PxpB [Candidatus Limnocylindrales bacterium]
MTESPPTPRIVPFGDAAILVTVDAVDEHAAAHIRRVHRLAAALRELDDPRFDNPVPGATSVLVGYDPRALDPAAAAARVRAALNLVDVPGEPGMEQRIAPLVELPTRYGGSDGPDLAEVASAAGLSERAAIELHASVEYLVAFLGFAPGFAYLSAVPPAIAAPRRATPRERVPAGSVGIADRRTAVYPGGTPGGWQLIGRTDVTVWDARRDPPALLSPGARVRFVPVER